MAIRLRHEKKTDASYADDADVPPEWRELRCLQDTLLAWSKHLAEESLEWRNYAKAIRPGAPRGRAKDYVGGIVNGLAAHAPKVPAKLGRPGALPWPDSELVQAVDREKTRRDFKNEKDVLEVLATNLLRQRGERLTGNCEKLVKNMQKRISNYRRLRKLATE